MIVFTQTKFSFELRQGFQWTINIKELSSIKNKIQIYNIEKQICFNYSKKETKF